MKIKIHDLDNLPWRIVDTDDSEDMDSLIDIDKFGCNTVIEFKDIITIGHTIFEPIWENQAK